MRTEILLDGPAFMERLEVDIARARERVWLQTLTFEADGAGLPLAAALERATCPDRRLLVDTFTRFFISDRFVYSPGALLDRELRREVRDTRAMLRSLHDAGIAVRYTNPAGPLLRRIFARDHKKLVVIDRRVAYIGGINFSDHNFAWRDLMVRIECPDVAAYLADDFEATWSGRPRPPARAIGDVAFHNIDGADNAARLEPVLDLIRGARTHIHVVSPYITDPFSKELADARARGVRVTMLGTSGNNRGFLDRCVRWQAVRGDLELRMYQGRMNHMKALLVDGSALVLGSSNFDWLSHSLLGEIVAVFRDPGLIAAFVRDVLEPDLVAARTPDPVGAVEGWLASRQVAALARIVPALCPPRRGIAVPAFASAPQPHATAAPRRASRIAAVVALIATTTLGACAPVLSHGPRVHDGTAAGINAAVISNPEGEQIQVIVPYITTGNDRGAGNGGRQFTAQWIIPTDALGEDNADGTAIFGIQGDYYVQAPTDGGPFVRGFGVHGSLFQIMPYGQWGYYGEHGGVYTTQGVGSFGPWLGLQPVVLFWSPGIGVEQHVGAMTVRVSISTMVGVSLDRMEKVEGAPISLGFAIELDPSRDVAEGGRE